MARLDELGEELQEAQRTLAGDRLRELSAQRRQVINDLLPAASDLASEADQPASAAVLGEVRATLEAALADPGARAAVRSGRLTKALAYAGLGEVDLSAALAVAAPPLSGKPGGAGKLTEAGKRAADGARGRPSVAAGRVHGGDAARPRRTGCEAAQRAADEAAGRGRLRPGAVRKPSAVGGIGAAPVLAPPGQPSGTGARRGQGRGRGS